MFKIENKKISITRGDIASFSFSINVDEETKYTFKKGDIVRFKVFTKKNYSDLKIQKDIVVTNETENVDFYLTSDDTRIGEMINKETTYWYEIELNPDTNPQTIIGHDEDGAKLFILYPEGGTND